MENSPALRTEGGWPAFSPFRAGETKLGCVPDSRLPWWEDRTDFAVDYSPEAIAETMLEANRLPDVFTPGGDPELRERVLDRLGIEPQHSVLEYRAALADVAGMDPSEARARTELSPDEARREALLEHTRADLLEVVAALEADIVQAGAAAKTDLADGLLAAEEDGDVTHRRVDALLEAIDEGRLEEFLDDEPVELDREAAAARAQDAETDGGYVCGCGRRFPEPSALYGHQATCRQG